jgi:hypothetical protein
VVFLGGFVLGGWRKMASLEKGGLWVKKTHRLGGRMLLCFSCFVFIFGNLNAIQ